jgi:nucleotide-binding universal stress UspA family protein
MEDDMSVPWELVAPVVVGVDDVGSADDAVDWATAEAAARGCPLRVVHAVRSPVPAGAHGFASTVDGVVTVHAAARLILEDAVARSRSVAPGVEVSTRLAAGAPVPALLRQARDARLLVLGGRRRSGLRAVLSGSVAAPLSRHSPCPIVVIRPFREGSAGRVSLRSAPRVVVGVDPAAGHSAAIGFAFHAAAQRGVPLTVLSAWTPDTAADIETVPGSPDMAEAAAGRAVHETLARWHEKCPEVPVVTTLVCADPAPALIAESSGAALLVIGPSRRSHFWGLACGSVGRRVLRDPGCPVAVVAGDGGFQASRRAVDRSNRADGPRRRNRP